MAFKVVSLEKLSYFKEKLIEYTERTYSKFSGSYNDLSDKPTIPTVPSKVSAFLNDANYAKKEEVPTKTSQLENDSGFSTGGGTVDLGTADISAIGDGTVKGAISQLDTNVKNVNVYVGEDSKLHFTDSEGADSVIPFSGGQAVYGTFTMSSTTNGVSTIELGFKPKAIGIKVDQNNYIGYYNEEYGTSYYRSTGSSGGTTAELTVTDDGFTFHINSSSYRSKLATYFAIAG